VITHARRAVPWPLVLACAVLVTAMMATVGHWTWVAWPLQGAAVGLLAATAVRCVDEPAAELVDTAPRGLRWRAASGGLGVLVLLGAWIASGVLLGGDLFGHRADVLGQGLAATLAAWGVAAWLRSRGVPAPGRELATWIAALMTGVALARPYPRALPLFPYGPDAPWAASRALWAAVLAVGVLALVLAASERGWRRSTGARLGLTRS
jgi:hypothetical protein